MIELPEAHVIARQITGTLQGKRIAEVTAAGGRDTERDLFGKPGGNARLLDSRTVGKLCPQCQP